MNSIKSKIALGKVKESRKTLFKAIAIGETRTKSELKRVETKGRRIFKGWSKLTKYWGGALRGRLINDVLNTLSYFLIFQILVSMIRPSVLADWYPSNLGHHPPAETMGQK